jgi:hypothetical protein
MRRVVFAVLLSSCSLMRAEAPTLAPLVAEAVEAPALTENHFSRDRLSVGEAQLKEILAAPVFLEEHSRIGVIPVQAGYTPQDAAPLEAAPATLSNSLDASGLFELSSEVSTDWPVTSGIAGLRELGARYRAEYLLLYRQRFNDVTHANGWAVGYPTLLGLFFLPGTTVETAGVLEATLFDVKTGTILFTINERARAEGQAAPPAVAEKTRALHRALLDEAAQKLAERVVEKCHQLVASRPTGSAGSTASK